MVLRDLVLERQRDIFNLSQIRPRAKTIWSLRLFLQLRNCSFKRLFDSRVKLKAVT